MKCLLWLLCVFSTSAIAVPTASAPGFSLPLEGYSVEPFCTYQSICLKKDWHRASIPTNDYNAIRKIASRWTQYKAGWLNQLEFIMQDVVLLVVYRDDYGKTAVLLEKRDKGQWAVMKEASEIY